MANPWRPWNGLVVPPALRHTAVRVARQAQTLRAAALQAAGVDATLADASSWSERCRLVTLGAIVLMVAVVHWLGTTTALLLVLQPARATSDLAALAQYATCIVMGAAWGLMMLNLFRFLVSSTGHGDGKPGLSLREAVQAGAKALLASLLALCAALPLTVSIVREDLRGQSSHAEEAAAVAAAHAVDEAHEDELVRLYQAQVEAAERRARVQQRLLGLRDALDAEGSARAAAGLARASGADDVLDDAGAAAEASRHLEDLDAELASRRKSIERLRQRIANEREQAVEQVRRADTLFAEAGRVLDHAAGVFWGVALFLIVLHASPVLIRALAAKGPYAHLAELEAELCCAREGIVRDHLVLRDGAGQEHRFDRYLAAERLSAEVLRRLGADRGAEADRFDVQANRRHAGLRAASLRELRGTEGSR